jgi:nitroimidazol reductase NimA-like FMN-containing flavoprotein (pyridoxamine 5'-phosphate oxidase superfamily)
MSEKEIDELINQQFLCRIAFIGKDGPYIAPFQYVVMDGSLYFHFTDYGRKIVLLKESNKVCVEIEKYSANLDEYSFVILKGYLEYVVDKEEKKRAVEKMAAVGKANLSARFLYAHGFESEDGWSVFDSEQEFLIIKLGRIDYKKGLKSPSKK